MIEIKPMPARRWPEYRALRLEALKNDPTAFGSALEEEKKLSDTEWRQKMKQALFVVSDNQLVGMAVFVFLTPVKVRHIANIFGVYVCQEFRGQGLGKKLITRTLSLIKKNKRIVKVNLHVNPKKTAAVALYQGVGFKVVGRLKKDMLVHGKFYDELIMEKFL